MRITAENQVDAQPFPQFEGEFGPSIHNLAARASLNATVDWNDASCNHGEFILSPDLSDMLQQLVSRSSWATGGHTALLINSTLGSLSISGVAGAAPQIIVYYFQPEPPAPDLTAFVPILEESDVRVESTLTGEVIDSQNTIQLTVPVVIGLHFRQLEIPRMGRILSAAVELHVARPESNIFASAIITAEQTSSAMPFTRGMAGDLAGRNYLSGPVVNWGNIPSTIGLAEEPFCTPDIADLIQDIVNRPSWNRGNSINIFITATRGSRSFGPQVLCTGHH